MMKSFFFIINPRAGTDKQTARIEEEITAACSKARADFRIERTQRPGHALELAQKAAGQFECVAVAGGDGTLNEAASALIGTETCLAVIPRGSGNGFARHIKAPFNVKKAIHAALSSAPVRCDAGIINGYHFINIAGIGLDTETGRAFNEFGKIRGKLPYLYFGVKEYMAYKPPEITIKADGKILKATPLLVAFANASQYGSNAVIAPMASIHDGLINVMIVRNEKWHKLAPVLPKLFTGEIDDSEYVEHVAAKSVIVEADGPVRFHADGEVKNSSSLIAVESLPDALNVALPQ